MRIVRWIVCGFGVTLLLVIAVAIHLFNHDEKGPPPISAAKASDLLNNCHRFTHVAQDTREVTAITGIAASHGSGGGVDTVNFTYRWISGPRVANVDEMSGKALFAWAHSGDWRKDYSFPDSQWTLARFDQEEDPKDELSSDCMTPMLIK